MSNKTQKKKINFAIEAKKNQQEFKIPWLIQRCRIADTPRLNRITPIGQNYDLDYMGSAEFEWGAPGESSKRIVKSITEFEIVQTDIQNKSGEHLFLYIRKYMIDQFLPYLNIWKDEEHQDLKEQIYFKSHYTEQFLSYKSEYNIWWDIQNDIWFTFGKKRIKKIQEDFTNPITIEYISKQ